ncbi:hypothetical protein D9756_002122 [Leucocoprinus leucothites]|uniref:NACHT domain-containing protein n=1 Tax=Leucocoprinus leucothites TaxID=201217 RepID=A0A8H5LMG2_9AGAR|nr:hypothetical protein D9756_002122 [Leucoagaricus leucothites]
MYRRASLQPLVPTPHLIMPRLSLPSPPEGKRTFIRKIFLFQRPPPPAPLIITSKGRSSTSTSPSKDAHDGPLDQAGVKLPVAETSDVRASIRSRNPNSSARTSEPGQGKEGLGSNGRGVDIPQSGPHTGSPSPGILNGAHDLIIQNSTFNVVYNMDKSHNPAFVESFLRNIDGGGTVLLVLDKKRVAGAEMDSSDREPPPRCHPETRKEIRETLSFWFLNPRRASNFIWLSGPAGAGKSAVAQTFAEYSHGLGRFGAAFFFSRLQNRDSPTGVIATIAYQLALRDAGYNHLITHILFNDPSILDKPMRIQFHKLIVEPFTILTAQLAASAAARQPLLIIIDGLDECSNEDAQCELIALIGEYVRLSTAPCPLLWLVCSRPEWHLKRVFAYADPPIDCRREEITCNAAEDIKDVYRILKDGLQQIRDKTCWDLSPSSSQRIQWPTESKLQRLSTKIGGLPVFASTVLRFIGDGSGTPDAQLEFCLLCLETMKEPSHVNPLETLDIFYHHIMLRVPQSIISVTKQILAFYILSSTYSTPHGDEFIQVFEAARFLQVDKDTFYFSLRSLHSVVDVPSSEIAHNTHLKFFHKSFPDFLQRTSRSGSFALDMDQARYEIAKLSVRWQNHLMQWKCKLQTCPTPASDESLRTDPRWINDAKANRWKQSMDRFQEIVEHNWCHMCTSLSGAYKFRFAEELAKFNFCHFQLTDCGSSAYCVRMSNLISWFLADPAPDGREHHDLIRLKPSSDNDITLAKKFPRPLPLFDSLPEFNNITPRKTLWFTSSHQLNRLYSSDRHEVLGAVWIGKGERTALAWFTKS